jgi:anti-sigma B factor antagonist
MTAPEPFSAEITCHEGRAVLAVVGDVDIATAPALHDAGLDVLRQEIKVLTLDLERLTYLDSSGISALIEIRRNAEKRGVMLRIIAIPAQARRVLELTGVLHLFEVDG